VSAVSTTPVPSRRKHRLRLDRGRLLDLVAVVVAVAALVGVWELYAQISDNRFVPTPAGVWESIVTLTSSGDTYGEIALTARRLAIATIACALVGIAIGMAMGLVRKARVSLLPSLLVLLAIPGPFYIVMGVLILGIGETTTMVALIGSVAPFVVTVVWTGVAARDTNLDEMAAVYNYSRFTWLRQVVVPQVTPTLWAALRTSYAFSWKLVMLMEYLSTDDGIGGMVKREFRFLRPDYVVGWVLLFVTLMFIVDALVFRPLEARSRRWGVGASPDRREEAVVGAGG
jgi:NitT/TauT family transport system permease protein